MIKHFIEITISVYLYALSFVLLLLQLHMLSPQNLQTNIVFVILNKPIF